MQILGVVEVSQDQMGNLLIHRLDPLKWAKERAEVLLSSSALDELLIRRSGALYKFEYDEDDSVRVHCDGSASQTSRNSEATSRHAI